MRLNRSRHPTSLWFRKADVRSVLLFLTVGRGLTPHLSSDDTFRTPRYPVAGISTALGPEESAPSGKAKPRFCSSPRPLPEKTWPDVVEPSGCQPPVLVPALTPSFP